MTSVHFISLSPARLSAAFVCPFLVPCHPSEQLATSARVQRLNLLRRKSCLVATASGGWAGAEDAGSDWRKVADAWSRVNNTPGGMPNGPTWRTVGSCDVLSPTSSPPRVVILFIGGFGAGFSPQTFYSNILRQLCIALNAVIIAYRLPVLPLPDHSVEAVRAASAFNSTITTLRTDSTATDFSLLPTIGMGHSLGSKLLLLACVDQGVREKLHIDANVFMSFSNARIRDAFPNSSSFQTTTTSAEVADGVRKVKQFLNSWNPPNDAIRNVKSSIGGVLDGVSGLASAFAPDATGEFVPSVEETLALAGGKYNVSDNLVLKFLDDSIDNGADLFHVLRSRFGNSGATMWREIKGTHVTPISPDFSPGSFASLGRDDWDQWIRQAGSGIKEEIDSAVAVIAAFIKLEMQLVSSRRQS